MQGSSVPVRWRQSSGRRGAGSLGTMGDMVQGNSVPARWNNGSVGMGNDGDGVPVHRYAIRRTPYRRHTQVSPTARRCPSAVYGNRKGGQTNYYIEYNYNPNPLYISIYHTKHTQKPIQHKGGKNPYPRTLREKRLLPYRKNIYKDIWKSEQSYVYLSHNKNEKK